MTEYALPPGELLAAINREAPDAPIAVAYYEELSDDDAAAIAAEIIGHQFATRSGEELMGAMFAFQAKLTAALESVGPAQPEPPAINGAPSDLVESVAEEIPETEADHGGGQDGGTESAGRDDRPSGGVDN